MNSTEVQDGSIRRRDDQIVVIDRPGAVLQLTPEKLGQVRVVFQFIVESFADVALESPGVKTEDRLAGP